MKKSSAALHGAAGARVPQYPIESVDNALKVLLLLGERSELRLTEVSEYLGVASSTAHRLLAMLQYRGFVRQNERTKAYGPGTALTGVAFSIMQRFDFRSVLRPYLERLNTELAETVHLGLLDGAMVRFIDAVESPRAVRVASRLGLSIPAHATSTGKAMLAQLTPDELHTLYPEEELEGLTERSIRSRSQLEEQLATVRRRGYATSTEESESGVSSVAVAFPYRGTPARIAFNAAVPASRMSAADQRAIGAALRAVVDEAAPLLHG
ncbi:IclR family transcriptional regulator domain-containing protein [Pseudonocardia acidicola]|uniref:IclR family transcriptional regulator n=1 Tax=Pseudonocardia acidicola TaxID=2724939 RepID=A0ABX1SE74_9PSEU|nr:IclR family transcriptional regulator [Pseudonocardia acidicola]